jgi:hypothetical protein
MSNWQLFRRSLADHPGLTVGYIWPLMLASAMLMNKSGVPPLTFWLAVFPAVSALPWIPILCTAWAGRKQYEVTQ